MGERGHHVVLGRPRQPPLLEAPMAGAVEEPLRRSEPFATMPPTTSSSRKPASGQCHQLHELPPGSPGGAEHRRGRHHRQPHEAPFAGGRAVPEGPARLPVWEDPVVGAADLRRLQVLTAMATCDAMINAIRKESGPGASQSADTFSTCDSGQLSTSPPPACGSTEARVSTSPPPACGSTEARVALCGRFRRRPARQRPLLPRTEQERAPARDQAASC